MAIRNPPFTHGERLRADLTLLVVSVVWGSAFVVQRLAALETGVALFNGLRFLIGALVLLPFALRSWRRIDRRTLLGIAAAGLVLAGGAWFQQLGLRYTTAGNAGFITGLYVVLIPLFLAVGWKQWPRPVIWLASLLATIGLFLLSTGGSLLLTPGDSLEFAGAILWAFHVILIGWLVQRAPVMQVAFSQYLVCGVASTLLGLFMERETLPGLTQAWWAVVYTGVLSVGVGYTLQAVGQKVAPPSDAAIILATEAVFAALFGWLFLSERLEPVQLLGAGFMLAGMILAQAPAFRPRQK